VTLLVLAAGLLAAVAASSSSGPGGRSDDHLRGSPARALVRHERPAAGGAAPASGTPAAPAVPATVRPPAIPPVLVTMPVGLTGAWSRVALVHGQPAAWAAQRGSITLLRFDQRLVHLDLHPGYDDGGAEGWTYGDQVTPREIHRLVAGLNGGFRLSYPQVGFLSGGHVAAPLKAGLASIVTYTDGTSDIGAWHGGVPDPSRRVFSVLQNQRLLVDRGVPAATVQECVIQCWGQTIGGRTAVARSALGIRSDGELVWAGGMELLPSTIARALMQAGAVRALELDINPDWVAGYLYPHHREGPVPVPVLPGQVGIAGQLLTPDSRDFLTVVASR
jgi:hypothetical protein